MKDLARELAGLSPDQLQLLQLRLSRKKPAGETARPAIPVQPRDGRSFPMSPAQQRFWFLERLQPGTGLYNVPVAARLTGLLDPRLLEAGFAALVERQEMLRTTFAEEGGRPVQRVGAPWRPVLPCVDLSALSTADREREQRRRMAVEAAAPFDLERGPLVRFTLLRLGPGEHVALLTLHHIAADRWSVGVFFRELLALYEALRLRRPSPLPPLILQYADYAVWQSGREEELSRQLEYWKERLAEAPALALPTDRPRPRRLPPEPRQGSRHARLGRELLEPLRELANGSRASVSMVLLAAFKAVLGRIARQDDLVVASPVANRNLPEVRDLVGHFAHDLVLRTDLSGDPTFREALARVRATMLGAFENADVPLDRLIEVLRPEREDGRAPLAQVFFVLENVPMPAAGPEGVSVDLLEVERAAGQLELLFYLSEVDGGTEGWLFYDAGLFEDGTMALLLDSWRAILERAASEPDARLSALPLAGGLEAWAEAARTRDREEVVALAATFTADLLADPLELWMEELGIPSRVEVAPFGQVFQELLDPSSLLSRNWRGVNVLLVRFEDWGPDERRDPELLDDLVGALLAAAERSRALHLVVCCPPSERPEARRRHAALEPLLLERLAGVSGVHTIAAEEALRRYPVPAVHDPRADELGRVPYTPLFFAALATLVARRIHAWRSTPCKIVAVDCDHTLWSGVCAEDGPLGVVIDEPRRELQRQLVELSGQGVLVCLCSKNAEADVDAVFAAHPDMPLQPRHIAARRIDWNPKSDNLRALARELSLGLHSFLVLDDNPVECAEIRARCPEALTVLVPSRGEDLPRFLRHLWAFDRLSVTDEDRRRTALYRENAERQRLRRQAPTLEEFLAALELRVDVRPLAPGDLARAAQLTVRTNQFNATGVRRTEAELRDLLARPDVQGRAVAVRDRFGDYGFVGLLLFRTGADAVEVDTFLLSCRALGKRVEHRMLEELGRAARERGGMEVRIPVRITERNRPVRDFLDGIGGAWREAAPDGTLYRLPAEVAADVLSTAAPAETGETVEETPETSEAPDAPTARRDRSAEAERLQRVASALSDPAAVLDRVRSRRRSAPLGSAPVEWVAPRTPIEEGIAAVWRELLGAERVGAHDSFFSLGGHSLLGTVLLSRLRDTFAVELPLFTLFEAPTLAGLAQRVEEALIRETGDEELRAGLEELAELSDEEVRALLAAGGGDW